MITCDNTTSTKIFALRNASDVCAREYIWKD